MNAHEVNAASKYIYPGNHPCLYLFNEAVYSKSPNMLFKIQEQQSINVNGQKGVVVKLQCNNSSQFFQDYMMNLGMLNGNDILVDTIFIRETNKGKYLSFDWVKINGENLTLALIADTTINQINIHSGEGANYPVVGKLNKAKKIVIDEYTHNPE